MVGVSSKLGLDLSHKFLDDLGQLAHEGVGHCLTALDQIGHLLGNPLIQHDVAVVLRIISDLVFDNVSFRILNGNQFGFCFFGIEDLVCLKLFWGEAIASNKSKKPRVVIDVFRQFPCVVLAHAFQFGLRQEAGKTVPELMDANPCSDLGLVLCQEETNQTLAEIKITCGSRTLDRDGCISNGFFADRVDEVGEGLRGFFGELSAATLPRDTL